MLFLINLESILHQLKAKQFSQMPFYQTFHLFNIYRAIQFFFQRGYGLIRVVDAAGDDIIEMVQFGLYVEGESVQGNPPAQVDTNGANFSFG